MSDAAANSLRPATPNRQSRLSRAGLRLGILSFAHLHAEGYQALLRQMPGVELVGFSDEDKEQGERFARQCGICWFSKHQDLLKEGLDGVIVCSENARHLELVHMAAEAGCHILCEKPVEATLDAALAMWKITELHAVRFMTAFPMRFAPSARAVQGMIRSGQLGRIYGVNGVNHSEIPKAHRAWFADKKLAGGGAVMDHTVHLADLLRWYFQAEVEEVYAEVDNLFYPGEVDVDTAGLILLKMTNGVQASIDCSWSRPTWYPRWGHLKMEVVGEQGAVVMDSFSQHVTLYSRGAARNPSWVGFGPDANRVMLEEFVASIREQREPSVNFKDGLEALRVALTAYESATTHTPVKLEH